MSEVEHCMQIEIVQWQFELLGNDRFVPRLKQRPGKTTPSLDRALALRRVRRWLQWTVNMDSMCLLFDVWLV